MAFLDSILDQVLGSGQEVQSNFEDLLIGAQSPGRDLRFIRGGIGDVLLNRDQPDPRLVQQQFLPIRQQALQQQFAPEGQFDQSQLLNFLIGGQRGFAQQARPATFSQFLKDPNTGKFLGSQSVPR